MVALLIYAVALFVAVCLSEVTRRSVLSAAVLFLATGFLFGGVWDVLDISTRQPVVEQLATLVLVAVLFTDGMRIGLRDLTGGWRLPARALIVGLPATLLATAFFAHLLLDFGWVQALLIGAALSPTDPVFAAAIVGRDEIPSRVRHLLNVESGLNDGLALPIVIVLLRVAAESAIDWRQLTGEVVLGFIIGVGIPCLAALIQRIVRFGVTQAYEPFDGFAIGLAVFAAAVVLHANEYLAAFSAGVTIATISPEVEERFKSFGERTTELLKLAALLVFGALISTEFAWGFSGRDYLFAAAVLFVARPVTLALSLMGSGLSRRERLVAEWFGPKGFASVVYALLILHSDAVDGARMFHIIALVVVASMILHSSTDVPVVHSFRGVATQE